MSFFSPSEPKSLTSRENAPRFSRTTHSSSRKSRIFFGVKVDELAPRLQNSPYLKDPFRVELFASNLNPVKVVAPGKYDVYFDNNEQFSPRAPMTPQSILRRALPYVNREVMRQHDEQKRKLKLRKKWAMKAYNMPYHFDMIKHQKDSVVRSKQERLERFRRDIESRKIQLREHKRAVDLECSRDRFHNDEIFYEKDKCLRIIPSKDRIENTHRTDRVFL